MTAEVPTQLQAETEAQYDATVRADIELLLGAYALHATEPGESLEIEAHLAECPRCRAEVAAHLEMAALLGESVDSLENHERSEER